MRTPALDLTGRTFGRLVVLRRVENDPNGTRFECTCECGMVLICRGGNLLKNTRSCGCLQRELKTIHGLTGTRVYKAWKHIVQRCYNTNHSDYSHYGGRGILMCEALRASALNLFALIGDCPPKLTIDRINNKLGYLCGSCAECSASGWPMNLRWATRKEQGRNRDCVHQVIINGEPTTLPEISERTGIHYKTIKSRWDHGRRGDALLLPRFSRKS